MRVAFSMVDVLKINLIFVFLMFTCRMFGVQKPLDFLSGRFFQRFIDKF